MDTTQQNIDSQNPEKWHEIDIKKRTVDIEKILLHQMQQ